MDSPLPSYVAPFGTATGIVDAAIKRGKRKAAALRLQESRFERWQEMEFGPQEQTACSAGRLSELDLKAHEQFAPVVLDTLLSNDEQTALKDRLLRHQLNLSLPESTKKLCESAWKKLGLSAGNPPISERMPYQPGHRLMESDITSNERLSEWFSKPRRDRWEQIDSLSDYDFEPVISRNAWDEADGADFEPMEKSAISESIVGPSRDVLAEVEQLPLV